MPALSMVLCVIKVTFLGCLFAGPKLKKVFCLYLFVRSRMALWLGLLVGFWSLCATAAHDAAALMAADDECGQDASCSLNALQVLTQRTKSFEEPTRCDTWEPSGTLYYFFLFAPGLPCKATNPKKRRVPLL